MQAIIYKFKTEIIHIHGTATESTLSDGVIDITGEFTVSEVNSNTWLNSNELYFRLKLYNQNSEEIEIPVGTKITIGDNTYTVSNGLKSLLIDDLETSSLSQELDIRIDFSGVLPQNLLSSGSYKIQLEYELAGTTVGTDELTTNIQNIASNGYGLIAKVAEDAEIIIDQLQLISKGTEEERSINISYNSEADELDGAYIVLSVIEQTDPFTYFTSSENIHLSKTTLEDVGANYTETITVTFEDSVSDGIYKILLELYDKYGNKITETYVNFIVYE